MIQSILTQGGCDITFTGESMQTYQPDLGIIGMPYLIKSDEHMEAVLTGEAGAELEGVREGTIVAAVLVGMIARRLNCTIGPRVNLLLVR